jgi:ribonuclease P protein component
LRARADFLRAARGRRHVTPGFVLQARPRDDKRSGPVRVGFTCSKKVGNAVARNRAKRRLRAIARDVLPGGGRAGWDYVLIGRAGTTASRSYTEMLEDLRSALGRVHEGPR